MAMRWAGLVILSGVLLVPCYGQAVTAVDLRSLLQSAGPGGAEQPAAAAAVSYASKDVAVPGGDWTDTGIAVAAGERVRFGASGSVVLEDGRSVSPAGFARGWKDLLRQFPLNSANTGALIGRVTSSEASVPFAIGENATVSMPSGGELFLRPNLSSDLAASGGDFQVQVAPRRPTTTAEAATQPAAANLVSVGLFADLPRRVTDANGDAGDMVNLALIGTDDQVQAAFAAAGWVAVDRSTNDAISHAIQATLEHKAYTAMPMSTLYLFNRPQDLSYARADPLTVAAERHHLRLWLSGLRVGGRPLWIGSATHDVGFERDQRTGGTTHKIDPEVDTERSFVLSSFAAAGVVASAAYVLPAQPVTEAHTATGGSFHSDGRVVVMDLPTGLK